MKPSWRGRGRSGGAGGARRGARVGFAVRAGAARCHDAGNGRVYPRGQDPAGLGVGRGDLDDAVVGQSYARTPRAANRSCRWPLHLTKPIRQSTLLDAIMTALGPSLMLEGRADPESRPVPEEGRRLLRLLLAEDNEVNQRLAVSLLKKRGHQVVVVGNGREALEAFAGQSFDAVPDGDVQMPEMDATFEATAAIRALASLVTGVRTRSGDHCHDRPRHMKGDRGALPRGRHGRLRLQTAPASRALRGPGRVGSTDRRPQRATRRPGPRPST